MQSFFIQIILKQPISDCPADSHVSLCWTVRQQAAAGLLLSSIHFNKNHMDETLQDPFGSIWRAGPEVQSSARAFLHWRHRVEVVPTLRCDRDLLPDVGQILQVWKHATHLERRHNHSNGRVNTSTVQ